MKVKYLIQRLKKLDEEQNIVLANDEELNELFDNVFLSELHMNENFIGYVIYPDERTVRV